jgi:hypothetical protein
LMPRRLEQWIYPIDKPDLDVLRFVHFLAMATVTLRFAPKDWPVLRARWLWPMILCGQHSLVIFCLGVFLAFAGYFLLTEISAGIGLHFLVGIVGILIMSAVALPNRVKLGSVGALGSSLLCPNERTSSARPFTSEKCQVRKWSVLTIRLIDFKHDYGPPDFYPGTTASPDRVVIPVNERPYGIYDGFNSKCAHSSANYWGQDGQRHPCS